MEQSDQQVFSTNWVILSVILFVVAELLFGGVVAKLIAGTFLTIHLHFMFQGIMILLGYFCSGFIISFISKGERLLELTLGAFLSVLVVYVVTFFTPISFIRFNLFKLIVGSIIALVLAYSGAEMGRRLWKKKHDL